MVSTLWMLEAEWDYRDCYQRIYKEGPYTESCAIEEVQEVKSSQDSDSDSSTRAGELVFVWQLIGGDIVLVSEARAWTQRITRGRVWVY